MTRRVAVLGMGLIGGSLSLALKERGTAEEVAAYDRDPDVLARAQAAGAIDITASTPGEAVEGAGLVVLATPVDVMPATLEKIAPLVAPDAVVTDVGSAKAGVVEAGRSLLKDRFVGGHPMAGSERHGFEAADAALFDDRWWILTPASDTSSRAFETVRAMVTAVGARPVAVTPEVHDGLVARLSHVPQLAASALVASAAAGDEAEELFKLAAGGFRDATRIAASDPDLWVAILRSNRAAVLDGLTQLQDRLAHAARLIEQDGWGELREFLDGARTARLGLFTRPDLSGDPVTLALPVIDRPGLLAEVTTAAGSIGANIEDLRIIHSTEGGQGRLEMVIAGADRAQALAERLEGLGYRVEVLPPGVESFG